MGTPDFARTILERLVADGHDVCGVFTQPDKPRNRNKVTPSPVKEYALSQNIPVFQPVTMRDGTDIAQEVADVIMAPSLEYLLVALDLGEATMKRIRSNVGISVGLNSAFLAGGLTGILMPAVSALLHNATTIGVCLNAMRPELGHYDGETRYADELRKDVADMFNRLGGVIRGVDSEAAGAPRVAVTALEATGVA